jgi:hypothetical protein
MVLAGETLGGQAAERPAPLATKREVVGGVLDGPPTVDDARGAVEVVGQQIVDAAAVAHGRYATWTLVVALGRTATVLVEPGDVDRGCATHRAPYPRPAGTRVGVVDKTGAEATPTDARQPVLVVVGQRIDRTADGAAGLVAIQVFLKA